MARCKYGHRAKRHKDGKCAKCVSLRNAAKYLKNRDAYLSKVKAGYANGGKDRAKIRRWRNAGMPEPTRPAPELCESCGKLDKRALSLDHCHVKGTFRGWLCLRCNAGLGMFGDNADELLKAVAYLSKHENG
jgi:Recombination endonuclease VII